MNFIIRPAVLDDMTFLLGMEQGVITAEIPFDRQLKTEGARYYDIEKLIHSPDSHLIVATLTNGDLIACGYVRIERSKTYHLHDRHGYLGFMYTSLDHRGQGVNRLIMSELINWAKKQGIGHLRLDVYAENNAAIRAYEKMGFRTMMYDMRLEL